MKKEAVERASQLCREAAELIDDASTLRLRTLIQMLLLELDRERELHGGAGKTARPSNGAATTKDRA